MKPLHAVLGLASIAALTGLLAPCRSASGAKDTSGSAAFDVVYSVLQHPRCLNCHPAGDAPLQGEDGRPHAQEVRRGPEGEGLYGMRCDACHQTANLEGAHLPPGAPNWHLPTPEMPLVFEDKSPTELCRALRDPAQNGGKTPDALLEHVASDPLVLWGWDPGPGRFPVTTPHAEFVAAMRAWVEGGCGCPGD
jgi:hypothetical protein